MGTDLPLHLGESGTARIWSLAPCINYASADVPCCRDHMADHSLSDAYELFGRKRRFHGARRLCGTVRAARSGTGFLDRSAICLLKRKTHRCLRVLQEEASSRRRRPRAIRADFRIVAATHHDHPATDPQGFSADDLFYRLTWRHCVSRRLRVAQCGPTARSSCFCRVGPWARGLAR